MNRNGGEAFCGSLALCSRYACRCSLRFSKFLYWGYDRQKKSGEIKGSCQLPLPPVPYFWDLIRARLIPFVIYVERQVNSTSMVLGTGWDVRRVDTR